MPRRPCLGKWKGASGSVVAETDLSMVWGKWKGARGSVACRRNRPVDDRAAIDKGVILPHAMSVEVEGCKAEVCKCGSVEVWKSRGVECWSVEVLKCGSMEVWKCGHVEVGKCGSVEMWRCGSGECWSVEV